MTVRDLCESYINKEEILEIFDLENAKTLFTGTYNEALKSEFRGEGIVSMRISERRLMVNI